MHNEKAKELFCHDVTGSLMFYNSLFKLAQNVFA